MTTRRKFLFQGTMAATAILAAKPFSSLAGNKGNSFFAGNNVLLLHTGNNNAKTHSLIQEINSKNSGVLLIQTTPGHQRTQGGPRFDVTVNPGSADQVIYKANVKIGIIHADSSVSSQAGDISKRAAYLKKEKQCHFVACISGANGKENKALAEASSHIDLIIGKTTVADMPMIILNKNQEEVIIDHAARKEDQLGKLTIGFNNNGQKQQLDF